SGQDARGAGAASATVAAQLHSAGASTRVDVVTDLDISGKAAQFGRGMIGDVSSKLLGQFVDCLTSKLGAEAPAATTSTSTASPPPAPAPAEPKAVDLLAVGGASAAKRIGPYVLGIVVLGLVIWGLIAWLG